MPCLGLKQFKVNVPDDKSKIETTKRKIIDLGITKNQVVIFVPKIELADMLYDSIREYHFHVSVVHRDLTKLEREEMVSNFYEMFTQILITTDLKYLNEGTIPCKVDMVVNFDVPVKRDSVEEPDIDLYLQRLPEKGVVFYLLCGDKENMIMEKLERHLDCKITEVPSWESRKDFELAFIEAGIRKRLMKSSMNQPILTYCNTSTILPSDCAGRISS
ncbi:ATP-dependent RNA helicase DBP5 [Artemisia annua]|uniref:ATP-dependent RNA helicase DBP5 n=1 Tax=Artemisia annua TaxID=35608 RepID=A0A2U1Q4P7_ARTAN|nr:ATP-dependent RNA helicase DBP5 [Artemisia annua]